MFRARIGALMVEFSDPAGQITWRIRPVSEFIGYEHQLEEYVRALAKGYVSRPWTIAKVFDSDGNILAEVHA